MRCFASHAENSHTERSGLACPCIPPCCIPRGPPPRVFHKADLGARPKLGEQVRAAVADPQQCIVGVVHKKQWQAERVG